VAAQQKYPTPQEQEPAQKQAQHVEPDLPQQALAWLQARLPIQEQ
jgi:hypothetical protein